MSGATRRSLTPDSGQLDAGSGDDQDSDVQDWITEDRTTEAQQKMKYNQIVRDADEIEDLHGVVDFDVIDQSELQRQVVEEVNIRALKKTIEREEKKLGQLIVRKAAITSEIESSINLLQGGSLGVSQRQSVDRAVRAQEQKRTELRNQIAKLNVSITTKKEDLEKLENGNGVLASLPILIKSDDDQREGSTAVGLSMKDLRAPGFRDAGALGVPEFSKKRPRSDERGDKRSKVLKDTNAGSLASRASRESTSDTRSDYTTSIFEVDDEEAARTDGEDEGVVVKKTLKARDDGDEGFYQNRLKEWVEARSQMRRLKQNQTTSQLTNGKNSKEWTQPHPTIPDWNLGDGMRLPGDIHEALFGYQKVAIEWFWGLHQRGVGGILGDEMGLGKTIQVISFLAGLHYSGKLDNPVLLVVPATLMSNWVQEFHKWWPPFRVAILHSTGSGISRGLAESSGARGRRKRTVSPAEALVDRIFQKGHVIITTYTGLSTYQDQLLGLSWGYIILDEGHIIRNPDSQTSLNCKRLQSPHRIILSGTPMQNQLKDLWSVFDFVYPGRLGVYPEFQHKLATPIREGSYSNAGDEKIAAAKECARLLRETISPYILQRKKADVARELPTKTERVIYCQLTKYQRDRYMAFLNTEMFTNRQFEANHHVLLAGIDHIRKICNHPDLADDHKQDLKQDPMYDYGKANKSGKMLVLGAFLRLWQKQNHRTLVFCQTVQMLNILEKFVRKEGYKFCRMDGKTMMNQRQVLVDTFNNDASIEVFLLTTKVGGLGLNLTGADRVVIFDPDWNPATDAQATQRSWRLGQTKPVAIYRLVMAGALEEKILQRQTYKELLTKKVLVDQNQQGVFKADDLRDLFSIAPLPSHMKANRPNALVGGEVYEVSNVKGVWDMQDPLDTSTWDSDDDGVVGAKKEQNQKERAEAGHLLDDLGVSNPMFDDKAPKYTIESTGRAKNVVSGALAVLTSGLGLAQHVDYTVPTWTGRAGDAGL